MPPAIPYGNELTDRLTTDGCIDIRLARRCHLVARGERHDGPGGIGTSPGWAAMRPVIGWVEASQPLASWKEALYRLAVLR